jgi:hypothetical protein
MMKVKPLLTGKYEAKEYVELVETALTSNIKFRYS